MGALSDWYKDTSIPPPKKDREEREKSGEATRCMRYVDFLVYCFGTPLFMLLLLLLLLFQAMMYPCI